MDTKTTTYRGYEIETHNPGQGRHTWHQVPGFAQEAHNEPKADLIPAFRTLKLAKAFIDRRLAEKNASTIPEMVKKFHAHQEAYSAERDRLLRVILDAQNSLAVLAKQYPSWITEIVTPIADRLREFYPDAFNIEILGPFGLGGEVSIHVNLDAEGQKGRSITFRPQTDDRGQFTLMIKDYDHPNAKYVPGSLGEINGLNYPDIPAPATVKELVEHMNRHYNAGDKL